MEKILWEITIDKPFLQPTAFHQEMISWWSIDRCLCHWYSLLVRSTIINDLLVCLCPSSQRRRRRLVVSSTRRVSWDRRLRAWPRIRTSPVRLSSRTFDRAPAATSPTPNAPDSTDEPSSNSKKQKKNCSGNSTGKGSVSRGSNAH